jgi:hypothetical protein
VSHVARQRLTLALAALALFALVFPADAFAAKRRSVRPGAIGGTNPGGGGGGCHTFGLVRAGLKATYKTTSNSGNVDFIVTYISDTGSQVKTKQDVTAPTGKAVADTTIDFETVSASLRATKHVEVKTTVTTPINLTTTVDMTFAPSLVYGPAAGWCAGATWSIPASTITSKVTTSFGGPPINNISTTIASTGEVLAVGESVTVPAGTFQTVKYRGVVTTDSGASPAIVWIGMQDNILIRQDALDAGGNVVSQTQLMSVQ